MAPSGRFDPDKIREWQPRLWARVIALVAIAAYVLAFIIENSHKIHLHFVFFTATVSLVWLILLSLALGLAGGLLLSQLHRRRRRRLLS
jgi:uncharacterized integral membrane protein